MVFFEWLKQELVHNSGLALRRFPVTLVYALITAALLVLAIENEARDTGIYRFILTTMLGIPLSFSISIYCERHELNALLRFICHAVVAALLFAYFHLFLPEYMIYSAAIRFALVAMLAHVWVAFAAYPRGSSTLAFWQFNRSLFLRFAVASLFAGVLYIGLSIALVSFDTLLGIRINAKRYPELFIVCAGIIHPWFFLAGVPRDLDKEAGVYPQALRVFAQYILIPLVAIYVFILYLYSIKVVVNWEWPRYKATYLVGLFSAPGILATLLLYPLSVSAWVKRYTRLFYLLLVPLVLMMLLCVYRRVSEQGLTEMMVIATAMGAWLFFISLFMLKTGGNNIRAVPVSHVFFLFVVSFGPFSAASLAQSSQTARLTAILAQAKVPGAKISLTDKNRIQLPNKEYTEVINKSRYLAEHYGAQALTPFVAGDNQALVIDKSDPAKPRLRTGYEAHNVFINHFLNTAPEKRAESGGYRTFSSRPEILPIKGYSALIRLQGYRSEEPRIYQGEGYKVTIDWQQNRLTLETKGDRGSYDFGRLYNRLKAEYPHSEPQLKLSTLSSGFPLGEKKGKISFSRLAGEADVRDIEFVILLP